MNKKAIFEKYMIARKAEVDSKHLGIGERADLVNSFFFAALELENPEDMIVMPMYYDLICYCAAIMRDVGAQSGNEQMHQITETMYSLMYSMHYSLENNAPPLGPGREEHEGIWTQRIGKIKDSYKMYKDHWSKEHDEWLAQLNEDHDPHADDEVLNEGEKGDSSGL